MHGKFWLAGAGTVLGVLVAGVLGYQYGQYALQREAVHTRSAYWQMDDMTGSSRFVWAGGDPLPPTPGPSAHVVVRPYTSPATTPALSPALPTPEELPPLPPDAAAKVAAGSLKIWARKDCRVEFTSDSGPLKLEPVVLSQFDDTPAPAPGEGPTSETGYLQRKASQTGWMVLPSKLEVGKNVYSAPAVQRVMRTELGEAIHVVVEYTLDSASA